MNSIQHLIEIALKEDIGPGDITTDNLIDSNLEGRGILIAKESLVVAGLEIVARVFRQSGKRRNRSIARPRQVHSVLWVRR